MAEFEEETYSTVFAALRHPLRRRILRTLAQNPRSFTDMQNSFNVNSAALTHHLDAMKDLLCKTEDGKYMLSATGEGAMALMERTEEPPKTTSTTVPPKSSRRIDILQMATIITAIALLIIGSHLMSISSVQNGDNHLPYSAASMKVPTQIGSNLYDTNINTTVPAPDTGNTGIFVNFRAPENISAGVYAITLNYLEYSPAADVYIQKQSQHSGEFLPTEKRLGAVFNEYVFTPFNETAQRSSISLNIVVSIWANTTDPNPGTLPIVDGAGGYIGGLGALSSTETRPYEDAGKLVANIGVNVLFIALVLSVYSFAKKQS
jgi:DNA-binding transcriptional ArsR family regulator